MKRLLALLLVYLVLVSTAHAQSIPGQRPHHEEFRKLYNGTVAFNITSGNRFNDSSVSTPLLSSTIFGLNALPFPNNESASVAIGEYTLSAMLGVDGYYQQGGFATIGNGMFNTAVGSAAMQFATAQGCTTGTASGGYNTAIGGFAMYGVTCGGRNVSVGEASSGSLTTGGFNTIVGAEGASNLTTGSDNTIIGADALRDVGGGITLTGSYNVVVGDDSGFLMGTANKNVIIGSYAARALTTGAQNTILGLNVAENTLATGSDDILIGTSATCDASSSSASNEFHLCGLTTDSIKITGMNATTTEAVTISGTVALPNLGTSSAAQTGTVCSGTGGLLTVDTTTTCLLSLEDLKDKRGDIENALATVEKIKPFWFTWKKDTPEFTGDKYVQPGMGAHQVESVDKRLVAYNPDGTLRGVRYQEMTAFLVAAIKEQQTEIENLRLSNDPCSSFGTLGKWLMCK